ncbi:MAG: hypothetical protein Q4D06_08790 [Coriobacteriia bacterium]|nr:hypothetical protein [Coriobacteriia bacterium]
MCFRPADTSTSNSSTNKCQSCGKTIQSMGGSVLKDCPFCKQPLALDIEPSTIDIVDAVRRETPGVPQPPSA